MAAELLKSDRAACLAKAGEKIKVQNGSKASLYAWLDPLGKNCLHVVHRILAESD